MILSKIRPVWSEEKTSVEKHASTTSQHRVGSQATILRFGLPNCLPRDSTLVGESSSNLFNAVIRGLAGDDDIVDMALTQARAADANEARFLLKFCDAAGTAISHTGAQATY